MNNLDTQDQAIVAECVTNRDKIDGPRIGDYIQFPTGELERFSHDWDDSLQTSPSGSFFLYCNGQASFSGGLNPATPIAAMALTDTVLPGDFWIFHHNRAGAGRGVTFSTPCRLYTTTAEYTGYLGREFQSKKMLDLANQI